MLEGEQRECGMEPSDYGQWVEWEEADAKIRALETQIKKLETKIQPCDDNDLGLYD